ncbi:MAG: threonine aldolase family protein [Woeseiaceae bacterium]
MIDLRSDTVTKPTRAMLDAMMSARVGDDVYGEDEAVNSLQQTAADLFGMEAALFCPSGTMTNQIGMRVHLQPGDEVICHELAHVYLYEGGGIASNSGSSVRLLRGNNGRFSADDVAANINPSDDSHSPMTQLVAIENTTNMGGGGCWDIADIASIREVCNKNDLRLHLDGARLFNALVATGDSPKRYGELFDTISICLSKGLGAPVGSLLLGTQEYIGRAHRFRKSMGGAMRQAGYLAAAGKFAIDNHIERLSDDHVKARVLGDELNKLNYVDEVLPVETNILIFDLADGIGSDTYLAHLREHGVLGMHLSGPTFRFVFHLDISDTDFDAVLNAIRSFG